MHVLQIVDKIRYDWHLSNKNAFGGGSISVRVDPNQAFLLVSRISSTYVTTVMMGLKFNVRQLNSVIPGDGLWESVTVQDVMDTAG